MTNLELVLPDRRRRRSESPILAMGYQLDQVVADFQLHCAVIADETGRVLAISPEADTEFLKAFARRLPAMESVRSMRAMHMERLALHWPGLEEEQIATCVFRAGGRRMYAGAVGPEAVMNEVAIFRAITGTRRIVADQES